MGVRDLLNRVSASARANASVISSANCPVNSGAAKSGVVPVASSGISLAEYINEKSADSGATPLIEAAKTGSNDIVLVSIQSCFSCILAS
ncbi:unnamed protein product [Protopolystoma xenopodis]|uniref:Uncharacterized protein n=1 Tax=Protopolystoma xenopodis TaxID=117903 RepID=A0A3S5AI35_9PLAT|nr:unnamed protein product [Protopolystoma xenopodis]